MALAVTAIVATVAKSGWPRTMSAGWPLVAGMDFQIKMRLLEVSATARMLPSEATAVGERMLDCVMGAEVTVTKSGCPATTEACPPHTGQRPLLGGISASNAGSICWTLL